MSDSDVGIRGASGAPAWTPDDDDDRDHRAGGGAGSAVSSGAARALPRTPLGDRIAHRLADRCDAFGNPEHDYDACVVDWNARGVGALPARTQLRLREAGDEDEVDMHDVQQRGVGDCAFMAPLAAAAATPAGRKAIHEGIREIKSDAGDVVAYAVRLYEPHWNNGAPKTFRERWIPVSAHEPYVVGHAEARVEKANAGQREEEARAETWPLVMEQAFAKLRGGYNAIGKNGRVQDAMEILTGKEVHHVDTEEVGARTIADALRGGDLVVLSTKPVTGNAHGLVGGHAYVVTGRTVGPDGEALLELHNPWNRRQPARVPESELARWFTCVDIGSVRGMP